MITADTGPSLSIAARRTHLPGKDVKLLREFGFLKTNLQMIMDNIIIIIIIIIIIMKCDFVLWMSS